MSKPDRVSVAAELTHYHLLNDPDIVRAFYVTREGGDAALDPLKLLQVSRAATPVGVVPVYFGASKEVPYPVVVIELAEEEFAELLAGKMKLPDGWDHSAEVFRSAA